MMETRKKLPARVVASYTFNSLATNSMWMLNNYFLLFFYTDVIQIPAAAASVIFLIARVWDAINDPMMGVICDKTKSKEGKSRFWMKRIAIPGGVFLALSYFCPDWATPAKILWAGFAYILQGMAQTAISIPNAALTVSITQDRTERVRLAQYTAVPSAAANALIPALTMPFVRSFGEGNMRTGFFVLAAILGVLYTLATLFIYRSTKGLDPDTSVTQADASATEKKDEPSAFDLIKAALRNKYCRLVTMSYMCYLLLSGIMGSTLIYYFRYTVGNEDLMALYSTFAMVGMFVAIATMRAMSKKLGNAKTCMIGAFICVLAMIPRMITGDQYRSIFIICMILLGIGSGYIAQLMHQCNLDSATYARLHGDNNPSVVLSLFTFAQKFGQALSSVLAAALLAAFNYTAGDVPSATVQKLFYVENIIFPMFIAVIMIALLIRLDKMEKQMVRELAAQNSEG